MSADITDDMKFNGRVVMYKNWADNGADYVNGSADPMQGRRPSDSSLFVDRAYVDWNAIKGDVPVTLTIGRQPSSDGPSHQFKDNTVRKATYSALSFDGGADGVVATIGLTKATGIPDAALRLGYGKGYQDGSGSAYVGDGGLKDSNVYGAFLDFGVGIPGSLVQLSGVHVEDIVSNVPGDNKNIGNMNLYTAMVEFTNLNDTGVDLFAHYAIDQVSPNGQTSSWGGMPVGLMTNTPGDTDTKVGHAYWIGGRYTLNNDTFNNPRFGLEYNHGSQNWFSFTQGSNDIVNKLATRGDAWEAYYIQPINRYAFLKFGAQWIDNDYSGSGYQIGAPTALSKLPAPSAAATIDKLTNYYMMFNVSY